MGIKLDWDVESDDGWDEIAKDPSQKAARKLTGQRWLIAGLTGLLMISLLVGGGLWRLRQLKAERRAELEAAVTAEATALRFNDRHGYLALQSPQDEWRDYQSSVFDQYQQQQIIANGDIVHLDLDLDLGTVVLREQVNGQSYLVTWFYQRTKDGWQHIPPPLDQWAEVETTSTAFDVRYRSIDAEYADQLTPYLDAWWADARRLTAYPGPLPQPEIQIGAQTETRWADSNDLLLQIASPLVRRRPEDSMLDPEHLGVLADRLAEKWAELAMETGEATAIGSDLPWYQYELAAWLRQQIAPDYPSTLHPSDTPEPEPYLPTGSTFLNPLAATFGVDSIPGLTRAMRASDQIVTACEGIFGIPASELPVDWASYLQHRLQAEASLIRAGYVTEVDLVFRDPDRNQRTANVIYDYEVENDARIDSIEVIDVTPLHDLWLANVAFVPANRGGASDQRRIVIEPFRLVNGRWVHTWLVADDLGDVQRVDTDHLIVQYRALDATIGQELPRALEELYATLSTMLQLPPERQPDDYRVYVTPLRDEVIFGDPFFRPYPASPWIIVRSPYVLVRSPDQTEWESAYQQAFNQMIPHMVEQKVSPLPSYHPIPTAFTHWVADRIAPGLYPSVDYTASRDMGGTVSLESLWPDALERDGGLPRNYDRADYLAAQALVNVLLEVYGDEAAAPLLTNLSEADSMEDWLATSVDGNLVSIEPLWQDEFEALQAGR